MTLPKMSAAAADLSGRLCITGVVSQRLANAEPIPEFKASRAMIPRSHWPCALDSRVS